MKRILIIMLLVILSLTGCNKNGELENNESLESKNSQQQINENKNNYEISNYQLSNKYELVLSDYLDFYNIVLIDNDRNEKIIENPYYFESDGKEYVIECKRIDNSISFDMTINGKKATLPNIDGGIVGVGVIDLDENDGKKEVVIRRGADGFRNNLVYQVNDNNELEEIASIQLEQLCRVNGKYIFPITLLGDRTSIVIGYYIYENGELKYIDRLLTGEKTLNDDGIFPDVIKNEIYTSSAFYMQVEQDGKYLSGIELVEPIISFKVLSAKWKNDEDLRDNSLVYEIELIEDARWLKDNDPNFEEIVSKGTVLKNVSIIYLPD